MIVKKTKAGFYTSDIPCPTYQYTVTRHSPRGLSKWEEDRTGSDCSIEFRDGAEPGFSVCFGSQVRKISPSPDLLSEVRELLRTPDWINTIQSAPVFGKLLEQAVACVEEYNKPKKRGADGHCSGFPGETFGMFVD